MAGRDEQNITNTDRSAEDSELEQYGVWVKAGPEDVVEGEAEDDTFALADLTEAEFDEATDLGADSDDHDFTIDDGGSVSLTIENDEEPDAWDELDIELDADDELESLSLDTEEDDELESLSLDTEEDDELMPAAVGIHDETEPEEIDYRLDDVLELDDLEASEEATNDGTTEFEGINVDDDLPDNLDDLTLDLDSLDVDAFDEPADSPAEQSEETDLAYDPSVEDEAFDLDALTAIDSPADDTKDDDTDDVVDLDLTSLPDDDDSFDLGALDEDRASEDDLPELELEDEAAVSLGQGFDDLSAVEDEMFGEPDTSFTDSAAPAEQTGRGQASESTSLLASIERELSSIRAELGDLKRELSSLRAQPSLPAPELSDDESAGGFFEDEGDEDDTIALTGAELDNIMHTAEFTEQTGEPTSAEEFGIVPGEAASGSRAIEQITLDDPDETGALDLDILGNNDAYEPAAVDELADIDIDAELADIEELSDAALPTPEPEPADDEDPLEDLLLDDDSIESLPEDLSFDDEPATHEATLDRSDDAPLPENLKGELRSVLTYMDQLLESLPEDKIQEFANSEHFRVYQRLFEELGLEQ